MANTKDKLTILFSTLQEMECVVVGFSGGVDSTFLGAAAYRALKDRAVAVTAYSATLPSSEREEAIAVARHIGIRHVLLPISELDSPDFVANSPERCYCKNQRFTALSQWACREGFRWVLEGSNADDINDYRPGLRAVAELASVRSPLLEAAFTKDEIRGLSKAWELPTWNKPSAACLSSRVAYGQPVTEERLRQIEQAEEVIKKYCFRQVRVRHHGNLARVEVSREDIHTLIQAAVAEKITKELVDLGFTFVTLDLAGYRMGSMNETINK